MSADLYRAVDEHRARSSAMQAFMTFCAGRTQQRFDGYGHLHQWAVGDPGEFWTLFLEWSRLPVGGSVEPAVTSSDCEQARFFPNTRLNYARCLLRSFGPEAEMREAVVGVREDGERTALTRTELRSAVERFAAGLRKLGVKPGDRVVAVVRNTPEATVACLAATAIGAMWSSVAPDIGDSAALSRFSQLDPIVLIAHGEFTVHGVRKSLSERVALLTRELSTVTSVIALDESAEVGTSVERARVVSRKQLESNGTFPMQEWEEFPFDQPLFVLFSSGTTGAPKCLMHGAGGTLIEHHKEHVLHSSFGPGEKLYFHTSAGWMMWNWQLSALACGTQIVVFDGSPTFPEQDALLRMLDREQVSIFGTSATYLHALQQLGLSPAKVAAFEKLHTLQSTGSILYDAQYDWIASQFNHLEVHSISGGTDIVGCFVLGNPLLPTYRGESQCVSLGMDVRVMTSQGVQPYGEGELVCMNPFPSRPVGIYGDPGRERFHNTYFVENPGMWTHGDQVRLLERGSARILGRSDGTLNVRGVRIGPAEVYSIVLDVPGVVQAMAVEQQAPREPGGSRLVLLLVLQEGVTLDRSLTLRIKKDLNQKGSPNHVPAVIVQVSGLPATHSGKYSEKAVRDLLNGKVPTNRGAMRNPETLDAIAAHPELQSLV